MINCYGWSKKSIRQNLANHAFLLLFPGFFFYHFAIARGFIPPVFGGYFGVVALFFLLPLFFIYLKNESLKYKNLIKNKVILIFILTIIYTIMIVFYNYALDKPRGNSYDMAVWSVSGLLFNLVAFLIGAQINFGKIIKINFIILILMLLAIILNVGEYGIFYVMQESVDGVDVATYQGFARSIVFVSLILTGVFIKNFKTLILVLIISVTALLLNGSRTEFVAYVLSSLIFFALNGLKSLKNFLSLIILLISLFFVFNYLIYLYPQSRMLELFALQESSSFDGRSELNRYGLSLIADNPLMGAYGNYVYLGGIGSYPHNLLSAWVNLGLLGFLFYLILFFILSKAAFLGFKKNFNNLTFRVFFIFLLFVIITTIFSKDYTFMAIGFLIGIYINWKYIIHEN